MLSSYSVAISLSFSSFLFLYNIYDNLQSYLEISASLWLMLWAWFTSEQGQMNPLGHGLRSHTFVAEDCEDVGDSYFWRVHFHLPWITRMFEFILFLIRVHKDF